MQKLAHNLPLQDLIKGVLRNAQEKLAAAEEERVDPRKVQSFVSPEKPVEEGQTEKTASLTDPMFIEKLASACDFIASNIDNIEPSQHGMIETALKKMAGGKSSPPAVATGAELKTTEAIGGKQSYKKDQASTNTPEKEVGSALSAAGKPGGKTQLENNMHDAPGGGSLKPTGKYPEKGPLVNHGKAKTAGAGIRDLYIQTLSKEAAEMCKHGKPLSDCGECSKTAVTKTDKTKTEKTKTAGEMARDLILQKLAGEDVMKANISASKNGGPLVGDGPMKAYDATQEADGPGGVTSGFGNQARKLIASNKAAIDATKKDAKGPVKSQLKEVLDEPALSPKTDSKLQENLRNTGEAGVKIAEQRALLQKIASEGTPKEKQNLRNLIKQANAMMGYGGPGGGTAAGGMTAVAEGDTGPDGCTCGHTGQCRVCKLKGALDAAKGMHGQQVEKDATY